MMPIRRTALAALPLVVLAFIACGDPFSLPPASLPTDSTQLDIYAMTDTPLDKPSAFNVSSGILIRTDRSSEFDFAVDFVIDSTLDLGTTGDTVVAVLPRGALGFGADPGVQVVSSTFEALLLAPLDGYVKNHAVKIDSGDVVVVTSRAQTCNFGFVRPLYAKFRVEQVNLVQRFIRVTMVTDPNCGYRGLGSGIPEH